MHLSVPLSRELESKIVEDHGTKVMALSNIQEQENKNLDKKAQERGKMRGQIKYKRHNSIFHLQGEEYRIELARSGGVPERPSRYIYCHETTYISPYGDIYLSFKIDR